MTYLKSFLLLFLSFLFLFSLMLTNLNQPTEAYAGPLPGFTPSPPSDDDDDADPPPTDSDESGRTPTDYVLVQLDQCDLACSASEAQSDTPAYQALAYATEGGSELPVLVPIPDRAVMEVQAPVRLVHEGSGFITEGTLSTQQRTRLTVPYPGQWEVFLTGQPQFMTAEAVEASGTNLAQLHATLANGPVSMGLVEANTEQIQLVKCPIACVIDTPPTEIQEDPPHLPQTGDERGTVVSGPILILILGLMLAVLDWSVKLIHPDRIQNSQENN